MKHQAFALEILAFLGLVGFLVWRWRGLITRGKAIGGCLAGFCFMAMASMGAFHLCDSGHPPLWLLAAIGLAMAGVVATFARQGWHFLFGALVFVEGLVLPFRLANAYHDPMVTGNPQHADGSYWHSVLTGILPRDQTVPRR